MWVVKWRREAKPYRMIFDAAELLCTSYCYYCGNKKLKRMAIGFGSFFFADEDDNSTTIPSYHFALKLKKFFTRWLCERCTVIVNNNKVFRWPYSELFGLCMEPPLLAVYSFYTLDCVSSVFFYDSPISYDVFTKHAYLYFCLDKI